MDKMGLVYAAVVFAAWGLSAFWDKLAVNSLGGGVAARMAMFIWLPSLVVALLVTIFHTRLGLEGEGMKWFFLSNLSWVVASIAFYLVLSKMELGTGTVITALYPILSVALGILFLGETMTTTRFLGILMGMGAIVLLSL